LTVQEVARLIDSASNLLDRTLLMVLYSTGMRNCELRHLQVQDIDSQSMFIHTSGGEVTGVPDHLGVRGLSARQLWTVSSADRAPFICSSIVPAGNPFRLSLHFSTADDGHHRRL
jgi:integrase